MAISTIFPSKCGKFRVFIRKSFVNVGSPSFLSLNPKISPPKKTQAREVRS